MRLWRVPICRPSWCDGSETCLFELALWLGKDIRFFNVFGYITLRTMLAALTALAVADRRPGGHPLAGGQKIGQAVRDDGPKCTSPRPARPPWAAR